MNETETTIDTAGTCDAALLPLGSAPVERCIKRQEHAFGDDKDHETAEGRRWRDPLDEED